ncbi:MAG: glycoside hydrolase family 3 C-terminal domain-containing protein [Treponema sp.]|jgi:beta-glucosidase|nr:glycoside hydrolase family 3 C-terminal domain-containing protein [Treponema sp.]
MRQEEIKTLVEQLTLEEKAALCSGRDIWHSKAVERLGIPSFRMSDGPHGLRLQGDGANNFDAGAMKEAVCFPLACASAASFDRDLLRKMGEEIGRECQALGVNALLGPGVNMKRTPLCGRNFEYFSEDPLVAGELGAAFVQGLQSQGAGACVKHFFANNQEYRRFDSSSEMEERIAREIYLTAFEIVVKKARPWTVMASYNKIGGVFGTENKKYLEEVLRGEWGFEGTVISDWGAVHDRIAAIAAGCDLTMPAENTDGELVKAVRDGRLPEQKLDACCERVIALAFRGQEERKDGVEFDYEAGHALAREIASQSIVLLKNEGGLLPLAKTAKAAFIGDFAASPRYQGGGSSHIRSCRVANALDAAKAAALAVGFARGYDGKDGSTTEALIEEAAALAKASDVAVVFAGLPDIMETEGIDRRDMRLPKGHNALIRAVRAAQPNTVVVLHNGGPVEMPWADSVPAILEAYLGGQAVSEAVVDALYGDINPSGHLAETFPKKLSDSPAYLSYPGENGKALYSERMFIGYRYYETKEMETLFPFGHGLSYTTFRYDNLTLDKTSMNDDETLTVSVIVSNTGEREGKAVAQVYVAPPKGEMIRPVRELREFAKVDLQSGESKTVSVVLEKRAFAFWNERAHDWSVESGVYTVQIGENAHDILLEAPVEVRSKEPLELEEYTETSPMKQFAKHPDGRKFIEDNLGYMMSGMAQAGFIPQALLDAIGYKSGDSIPLGLLDKIGQHAGGQAAGGSLIDGLLNQPLSLMLTFAPEENRNALKDLLIKMNSNGTIGGN